MTIKKIPINKTTTGKIENLIEVSSTGAPIAPFVSSSPHIKNNYPKSTLQCPDQTSQDLGAEVKRKKCV
jgi:hypothetical protein